MALAFDDSAGISFDADYNTFDSPDSILIYVDAGIASEEAIGTFAIATIAEAEQILSEEAWNTPLLGHRLAASAIDSGEVFEAPPITQITVQWAKDNAPTNDWDEQAAGAGIWTPNAANETNWRNS